jgi:hypothetical protein
MVLTANAAFGGTVAPQGSATVAFTADGSKVAIPVVYPGNYIYTFEVATGAQFHPRFAVADQPNYLTVFGPDNRVGVVCSGATGSVWLIDGLLGDTGAVAGGATAAARVRRLGPSVPNPFASATSVTYSLPEGTRGTDVALSVYDVQGRVVRMLVAGSQPEGTYSVTWDGTDAAGRAVPGGAYFVQLRVDGASEISKVIVAR